MYLTDILPIIASFCVPKTKHILCRICKLPFNDVWAYKKDLDPETKPNGILLARNSNVINDINPDIIINPICVGKFESVKYIKSTRSNTAILGMNFPNLTDIVCISQYRKCISLVGFDILKNLKRIYCINCNIIIDNDFILEECYFENCYIKAVYFPQKIVTKNLYLKDTTLESNISIDYQNNICKEDYLDNFSILSL